MYVHMRVCPLGSKQLRLLCRILHTDVICHPRLSIIWTPSSYFDGVPHIDDHFPNVEFRKLHFPGLPLSKAVLNMILQIHQLVTSELSSVRKLALSGPCIVLVSVVGNCTCPDQGTPDVKDPFAISLCKGNDTAVSSVYTLRRCTLNITHLF